MSTLPKVLQNRPLPVIGAPLFIISNPSLVIEQCKAGVIGTMPSLNARPVSMLDEWLHEITETLAAYDKANPDNPSAPFGINLIVHKTSERLEEDLALVVKHKVPVIVTSLGAMPEVNDAIHSYGGITLHDVINNRHAHKAIEKGADGLIAVAAGAGGHAGTKNPIPFIQELREWFDGPLALSGSISTGDGILAAQAMGADFAYIGSAFIATQEARCDDRYKQAIVDYCSDDITYTNLFTGVHGNYLTPSIRGAGLDPDNLPTSDPSRMVWSEERQSKKWSRHAPTEEAGDQAAKVEETADPVTIKAWRDVWGCGQGIGSIKEIQTTADYVAQLQRQYDAARARIS
jgi:nitronate monooxygenase